jgi:hypothetical protein
MLGVVPMFVAADLPTLCRIHNMQVDLQCLRTKVYALYQLRSLNTQLQSYHNII